MAKQLKPTGARLTVRRVKAETDGERRSKGGIILPETVQTTDGVLFEGEVLMVGPEVKDKRLDPKDKNVRILYSKYNVLNVEYEGIGKVDVMTEAEVIGILA